jgi:hypothetical protein
MQVILLIALFPCCSMFGGFLHRHARGQPTVTAASAATAASTVASTAHTWYADVAVPQFMLLRTAAVQASGACMQTVKSAQTALPGVRLGDTFCHDATRLCRAHQSYLISV